MGFWGNICDACSNIGGMFSAGFEDFKNLNFTGGISKWGMGAASAVGNIVTLGGANAIGNVISDGVSDNTTFEAKELANGDVIYAPHYSGPMSWFINDTVNEWAESIVTADSYEDSRQQALANGDTEAANNWTGAANGATANMLMDEAWAFADTALLVTGIGAVGAAAKAAGGAGKVAAETATKEAVKGATEQATKAAAETATKAAVKAAVKETGKKAIEQGTKGLVKNSLKHFGQVFVGSAVAAEVNQLAGDTILKTSQGEDIQEAVVNSVGEEVGNATETVTRVVGNVAPGISRLVNTIGAGLAAVGTTISKTTPGLFITAVCKKAGNGIRTWATGVETNTKGLSIQEVMDKEKKLIEANNLGDKSMTDIYVDEVVKRDKADNIDWTTRKTVQNHAEFLDSADDRETLEEAMANMETNASDISDMSTEQAEPAL